MGLFDIGAVDVSVSAGADVSAHIGSPIEPQNGEPSGAGPEQRLTGVGLAGGALFLAVPVLVLMAFSIGLNR